MICIQKGNTTIAIKMNSNEIFDLNYNSMFKTNINNVFDFFAKSYMKYLLKHIDIQLENSRDLIKSFEDWIKIKENELNSQKEIKTYINLEEIEIKIQKTHFI